MFRSRVLLALSTALTYFGFQTQAAVANDGQLQAAVASCSAGMTDLKNNMYKYPAPVDSWRSTFTNFSENNYPDCVAVGAFLEANASNQDVQQIKSMMASDGRQTFDAYFTSRDGIITAGNGLMSQCPNNHRSTYTCTIGDRLTSSVIPEVEKVLRQIANMSPADGVGNVVAAPGSVLERGKKYYSASGCHYLIFQTDNNVVVYTSADQFVWATQMLGINYAEIGRVNLQSDGNFAFYKTDGSYIWSALNQSQPSGTSLHLGDDGALRIIRPDGNVVWKSHEGQTLSGCSGSDVSPSVTKPSRTPQAPSTPTPAPAPVPTKKIASPKTPQTPTIQNRQIPGMAVIDILFAYTKEAADLNGGVAALKVKIDGGIDLLNEALVNSQTNVQARAITQMVEIEGVPVPSNSDAYSVILSDLKPTDGKYAGVHQARKQFGADLIAIVTSGFLTGKGNLATLPLDRNVDSAFIATHFATFDSSYVFSHEFGHALGCAHQVGQDRIGPFTSDYARGFNPGYRWRTVTANGGVSIPYFSADREVTVKLPGESNTTSVRIGNARADCSRNIREVGPTFARFGDNLPSATPTPSSYSTRIISDPASVPATAVAQVSANASNISCSASSDEVKFNYSAGDTARIGFRHLANDGSLIQGGARITMYQPGQNLSKTFGRLDVMAGNSYQIWQLPIDIDRNADWETLQGAKTLGQVTCR